MGESRRQTPRWDSLISNVKPVTEIDRGLFRTVLGHFASGVVVVTGLHDRRPVGFTCQSFMSLSLDPAMVAIAPGKESTTWPRIEPTGQFGVSVLTEDQEPLARVFATSGADKFRGVGWSPAASGVPRLHDALAWIDCEVAAAHDAGDHHFVYGRVTALEVGHGEPLLFYRGGFGGFRS
jgi:3-hydroxy-9,10-secoandrosta-1,3,5(10)-triene-9,17-dione monooxygenase reductase component